MSEKKLKMFRADEGKIPGGAGWERVTEGPELRMMMRGLLPMNVFKGREERSPFGPVGPSYRYSILFS